MNGFSLRCLAFCVLLVTMLVGEAQSQTIRESNLAGRPEQVIAPSARVLFCADQKKVEAEPTPGPVLQPYQQNTLVLVNQARARRGLRPLVPCPILTARAEAWARHMASCNSMYHGPAWENIARSQATSDAVMQTWLNSSGHYANIMSGATRIGIGALGFRGRQMFWCMQFGR